MPVTEVLDSPIRDSARYSTFDPSVVAIALVLLVTLAALWSNPQRRLNVAFGGLSIHVVLWLLLLHTSFRLSGESAFGLTLVRSTSGIGAFFPFTMWLVMGIVTAPDEGWSVRLIRGRWWFLCCAILSAICYTQLFIPDNSTRTHPIHGPLYFGYIAGTVAVYLALAWRTIVAQRRCQGVQRIELGILILGGCATATVVLLLMLAATILNNSLPVRFQPLVIVAFYSGIVFTMATRRVFDARQLVMVVSQRFLLVVALVAIAGSAYLFFAQTRLPFEIALIATTATSLFLGGAVNRYLNRLFQFYPQATEARTAVYEASRGQITSTQLEAAFVSILKGWGHTGNALLIFGPRANAAGDPIGLLPGNAVVTDAMRSLMWATPERISRERTSPARQAVAAFIRDNDLGALVFVEGSRHALLVGVGLPTSRSPFTYPQIAQLSEVASLMESSLDRAQYSATAQHAQQLATIGLLGANLALELHTPIVAIRQFLKEFPATHLDDRFCETRVAPVNAEITRIEKVTSQLLDLSQPRAYSSRIVDIGILIEGCIDLVRSAAEKRVACYYECSTTPHEAYTDGSAVKQVLLNLLFNAMQAVDGLPGDRWIKVTTTMSEEHVSVLVEDNGPGVDPSIRPRLFEPFQSTKPGRLGLGLAISHDILANLKARLTCSASQPGRGATFIIELPRGRVDAVSG